MFDLYRLGDGSLQNRHCQIELVVVVEISTKSDGKLPRLSCKAPGSRSCRLLVAKVFPLGFLRNHREIDVAVAIEISRAD